MIQLGLTFVDDINYSTLSITEPLQSNPSLFSIGKKKLRNGLNGFVITNIDGYTGTPITISTPGVYKFQLRINTSVGDVFSKISVKTL